MKRQRSQRKTKKTTKKKAGVSFFDTLAHLFHPRRSNNHRPRVLHPEALIYLAIILIGVYALLHTVKFFPKVRDSILGYLQRYVLSVNITLVVGLRRLFSFVHYLIDSLREIPGRQQLWSVGVVG